MAVELKPCPFCGGLPRLVMFRNACFVKCKCGIEQSEIYHTKDDAIRHWNREEADEPLTEHNP